MRFSFKTLRLLYLVTDNNHKSRKSEKNVEFSNKTSDKHTKTHGTLEIAAHYLNTFSLKKYKYTKVIY